MTKSMWYQFGQYFLYFQLKRSVLFPEGSPWVGEGTRCLAVSIHLDSREAHVFKWLVTLFSLLSTKPNYKTGPLFLYFPSNCSSLLQHYRPVLEGEIHLLGFAKEGLEGREVPW